MKHFIKASLCALAIASAPFTLSAEVAARPMTEVDLATMKRLGAPTVSADGKWAAYQVTSTDADSFERSTRLYLLRLDSENAQPIAVADHDGADEHSPSFAPDGSALYYLSDRSGSEQLWHVPLSGDGSAGTPVQASDLKADIAGYHIAPNGTRVAVWGDIAKNCPTFGCDDDGNRADDGLGTGREYGELFVRHWSSWETPGNYSRIFMFDMADGKITGSGKAADGEFVGDSPSKPFGGGEEVVWAPDSTGIGYAMRIADGNEPKSTNLDIYGASFHSDQVVNLTPGNKATDTLPAISPDGKYLAWAAMERPGYESDRLVVMLRELKTPEQKERALTKDWDRSVGSIAWASDGKSLIVTAQDVLDHPAFRVDVTSGNVTRLTGAGNVHSVTPLADGSIIYAKNSLQAPNDLYRRDANGTVTQLTNVNGAVLAEIDPIIVDRFSFAGAEGETVWGQIIKPTGTARGDADRLPVAFLVHGGPQGSFGNSWSFRWNPKVMASQGYAAVTVDFHGSVGYGQEFTDSINKDWGGKPLTDLKLGLAAAGKEDSSLDTANACALGASYGGYMMNWIAGNWNDGFKCIVNHAGIFDLRSFAYSTEELWFDQWDHGGPWWSRADAEKWNPANHVENWQTPMLVIHGEKDFRIPYTQSLMPFTVLQEKGIDSRLLIYPDENHWINKPKNSIQWHRNVFRWLDKYIGDGEGK